MVKCKAITKHGTRCPHDAVIDGFCMVHFQYNRGLMSIKKDEQNNNTRR